MTTPDYRARAAKRRAQLLAADRADDARHDDDQHHDHLIDNEVYDGTEVYESADGEPVDAFADIPVDAAYDDDFDFYCMGGKDVPIDDVVVLVEQVRAHAHEGRLSSTAAGFAAYAARTIENVRIQCASRQSGPTPVHQRRLHDLYRRAQRHLATLDAHDQ